MPAPPQSEIQKTIVQAVGTCPHPLNLNDLNIIVGFVCLNQKKNLIAVFPLSLSGSRPPGGERVAQVRAIVIRGPTASQV